MAYDCNLYKKKEVLCWFHTCRELGCFYFIIYNLIYFNFGELRLVWYVERVFIVGTVQSDLFIPAHDYLPQSQLAPFQADPDQLSLLYCPLYLSVS